MNRKIIEIIKVIDELMFEMFMKNKTNHRNLSVCDIKKLIKAINGGHPWHLMVNTIEMKTLLKCCVIGDPFDEIINHKKQLDMKQNQFEFKPFDQVLVRYDGQSEWTAGIYSKIGKNCMKDTVHECIGGNLPYRECIPYNEETANLLGTTKAYNAQQQKEYHVWSNSFDKWMTEDEFQNFITTAVIHNKDITDFHVFRIKS